MRATEHGQHLIKLTQFGVINFYLVREDDGFTLIDAGQRGVFGASAILPKVRKLGDDITRIALTHAHGDHVGLLDGLTYLLPDVELAVGAREAPIMAGDKSLRPGEAQGDIKGGYPKPKSTPTRLLEPGDRVGSLEVVASPGHTPGHISFLDTRDRTLVAGDALVTQGGIAVAGVPRWSFPLPAFATWDLATALESSVELRALAPSRLATGHGKVLEDPATAMDEAIATAAKKLKQGDPPPPAPSVP